ncbi:MAG: flotillin family protein [Alphaproteobacteria bacterium]
MPAEGIIVLAVLGGLVCFFLLVVAIARRYKKVGPNEVLIMSGLNHTITDAQGRKKRVGYRLKKGGGAFVWPLLERADILSLEIMTLDVITPEVYTELGVPVMVDGVAQIKVKGDDASIRTAAEQFLSKGLTEIMNIALQTVEGHLRAILGTMTVEDIYKKREAFSTNVQDMAATDLANMGLQIVSFTLRDIRDKHGYLEALGKPRTAEVKRDAVIAQAEADRDAVIKSAEAKQAGEGARYKAETKIAEAEKDYASQKQDYEASVETRRAERDLAYDLQKFKKAQLVKAEEVQIDIIEKQKHIELEEKEITRRELELKAGVHKPAEAAKYKIQQEAEASKFKESTEADGRAAATKAEGLAQAAVERALGEAEAAANKAKGLAEADVIRAQGLSEAEAMSKKAEAWASYNEAAIIQMFIEMLPNLARAIAEPLTKTDRITIVNTGGDTGGASKVTGDVATAMAQLPPVIESLAGVNLLEVIQKIPGLGDKLKQETAKKSEEDSFGEDQ